MKKHFLLSLIISFSFYGFSQDCPVSMNTIFHNDSSHQHFSIMDVIKKEKSSCNEFILHLNAKDGDITHFDISDVYALSFYYQSGSNTTIKLAYASGNNWSKETVIHLDDSPGKYHSLPLSIFANRFEFDISKLSKIRITIDSKFATMVDELNFEYSTNKPNNVALEELQNRLRKVNSNFKQKKQKEHSTRWYIDRGNIKADL